MCLSNNFCHSHIKTHIVSNYVDIIDRVFARTFVHSFVSFYLLSKSEPMNDDSSHLYFSLAQLNTIDYLRQMTRFFTPLTPMNRREERKNVEARNFFQSKLIISFSSRSLFFFSPMKITTK